MSCFQDHIALKFTKDVDQICEPLFNQFGLNYFDYVISYKNGSTSLLISDPEWHRYFFSNKIKIGTSVFRSGVHLWSSYPNSTWIVDAKESFNHDMGISIFKEHENYYEMFNFATYANNHRIIDFYFNNLDLLDYFILYFKDKAKKIIETAIKHTIKIPLAEPQNNTNHERNLFVKNVVPKKYYFEIHHELKYLTQHEMQVIAHLSKGKTIKEIGKETFNSHRTIESHIKHIKEKFGVTRKMDILHVFSEVLKQPNLLDLLGD